MTSDFSSPAIKRLYATIICISSTSLPLDIGLELFRWDTAVERGNLPPAEVDSWADRIVESIKALGRTPTNHVVGFPTPPDDPPTCSPSW